MQCGYPQMMATGVGRRSPRFAVMSGSIWEARKAALTFFNGSSALGSGSTSTTSLRTRTPTSRGSRTCQAVVPSPSARMESWMSLPIFLGPNKSARQRATCTSASECDVAA